MRRALVWSFAGVLLVACVLPKVDVDPSLGTGSGGSSGSPMTAGPVSGGSAGTGVLPEQGGTGDGTAGASDDPRELACGDYCTTYIKNCHDSPANTYTGLDDCLDTCFTSDWPFGTDDTEPNSLQCRVVHAHLAATLQDPHCYHSAEVPSKTICALPTP
jgi:hypothetical protein